MTLKEKAKAIREKLKAEGIKASVRKSRGSAINVDIKDLSADRKRVEEVARQFERINRCEYSNEILAGGNDFVFVQYDYDTLTAEREKYLPLAEKIIAERSPRYCYTVAETNGKQFMFWPGNTTALDSLVMNTDERQREWEHGAYNKHALAEGLAIIDNAHGLGLLG